MALKELSLTLGVLAGTAGVTNGGYTLYHNFVVEPDNNAEYNLTLMDETPLVSETVELQPDASLAMRVEVTVKIYRNGTILVESGSHRQFIPFSLTANTLAMNGFFPAAYAGESIELDGISYDVEEVKYTESITPAGKDRLTRVRIFADGMLETSIIDIRSNQVLELKTLTRPLTDEEGVAIGTSPYKKKIFTPNE